MMIRFLPDTWREALLRPLAMAAPDAFTYIEIMAPDFRFVFVLALLLALAVLWLFRRRTASAAARPAVILTGAVAAAFVPWLATTANGRYFIPFLLAVGPLCIALVWLLPMTRGFRLSVALCLVAMQAFAVQQSSPWQSWGLVRWEEPPFFDIELPQDMASEPATYVTIASVSYSLIAPRFPAASRWINLANTPGAASGTPDGQRAQKFLAGAAAGRLTLLVPAIPKFSTRDGMPEVELVRVINTQLAEHRLELLEPHGCRLLGSRGLAATAVGQVVLQDAEKTRKYEIWACPLKYPAAAMPAPTQPTGRFDLVFQKLESQCQRFFPPGQTGSTAISGGAVRNYSGFEMKAYVLDGGEVLYKYYRALNPVKIGTIGDVLSGKAKVDCGNIRGRSGLPWERKI
jgi:hypothetical protein